MFPQKPDFHGALGGDQAKELYQLFVSKVQQSYKPERVKDGVFQAKMVCLLSRVSGFCVWELTKNRKLH
jgi:D-Tyr-tRNAtyr deacylase